MVGLPCCFSIIESRESWKGTRESKVGHFMIARKQRDIDSLK
jgi:hypothetical protein